MTDAMEREKLWIHIVFISANTSTFTLHLFQAGLHKTYSKKQTNKQMILGMLWYKDICGLYEAVSFLQQHQLHQP